MSQSAASTAEPDAGPGPSACEDQELTCDDVFDVLSNRRRRLTLYYLQQNGTEAPIGPIATQVAAWESAQPREEVTAEERKRVYTSLQQFHLPKMDDAGVVTFDEAAGVVSLAEAGTGIDVYRDDADDSTLPWGYYYLGLAGVGAGLVSLSWLGVGPFDAVPNSVWVVLVLAVLVLSALVQIVLTSSVRLDAENALFETDW